MRLIVKRRVRHEERNIAPSCVEEVMPDGCGYLQPVSPRSGVWRKPDRQVASTSDMHNPGRNRILPIIHDN